MTSGPPTSSRRLAAFWFADIVGFTNLSARDERAALQAVDALRSTARAEIERASGRLVKVSGDAVLAEFASGEAALRSAIALRDALASRVPLHFGVHLGEVTENHGDIYGDGVNTAARLQARALAGQVLVSEDIFRHMRANPGFSFQLVGELGLKGIEAPVRAYCVEWAESSAPETRSSAAVAARAEAVVTESAARREVGGGATQATRVIVTPFRLLRPDTETDFLSFSLADAVSFSLGSLESVVVRSPHMTGGAASSGVDPREVARQTDVDMVVSGTLLRVGDRLQVTAELTDGRDGTRLGSFRTQAGLGDLFALQDEMTHRIVSSLALPLNTREAQRMSHDVPRTARAYELYLRANEYGARMGDWATPRDLYLAALAEDPTYAPAWARLGRCYRLLGKYGPLEGRERNFADAQAAFAKAVELNPDLDLAHSYAAQIETETGRCGDAMERLLGRLESRPRGVDLLAGLVHSLRYCGLLEESVAAHRAARAIDPSAQTSVAYTHFQRGEFEAALGTEHESDFYVVALAYVVLGRTEDARRLLQGRIGTMPAILKPYVEPVRLLVAGEVDAANDAAAGAYVNFPDPEGRYFFARQAAFGGRTDQALEFLRGAAPEYAAFAEPGLDPWLASIDRGEPYARLLAEVGERRERLRARFNELRRGRPL